MSGSKPLTTWKCDTCGEPVTAADGYVVWDDKEGEDTQFHIVHRKVCDDRRFLSSLPLDHFLGADGLNKILGFLSGGRLLQLRYPEPSHPRVKNIDDFVDFIRRVQLPFYEEARPKFDDYDVQERMSDQTETAPYIQASLKKLAKD